MGQHNGYKNLQAGYDDVYQLLQSLGEQTLDTRGGHKFTAFAGLAKQGGRKGMPFVGIRGSKAQSARIYPCCWGHTTNCHGTRIGGYSEALDAFTALNFHRSIRDAHLQNEGQSRLANAKAKASSNNPTDALDFGGLPITAERRLQGLARGAAGVVPVETRSWLINTGDLDPEGMAPEIVEEIAQWAGRGHRFIYCFQMIGDVDFSLVERSFSDAKSRTGAEKRTYPRLNRQSQCLYVGGSEKLAQRFKEHLGYGNRATYSLQLAHWARSLRLDAEFVCAKYDHAAGTEVYQVLEDALWHELGPMFGREGKR